MIALSSRKYELIQNTVGAITERQTDRQTDKRVQMNRTVAVIMNTA